MYYLREKVIIIKCKKQKEEVIDILINWEADIQLSKDGMRWYGWVISIRELKNSVIIDLIMKDQFLKLSKDQIMTYYLIMIK